MTNNSRSSYFGSRWKGFGLCSVLMLAALLFTLCYPALAQDGRKVKVSIQPDYPDLARKNRIQGVTRLQLAIAPDGSVKDVKVLGGNPVLVQASVEAVKKWKYEEAPKETVETVEVNYQ